MTAMTTKEFDALRLSNISAIAIQNNISLAMKERDNLKAEVERLERVNDKLRGACRFAREHLNDNGLSSAPSVADVLDAALATDEKEASDA